MIINKCQGNDKEIERTLVNRWIEDDEGFEIVDLSNKKVRKFNPYHDKRGRFATRDGSTSFTYAPGKSKAHDLAIQREKERFYGNKTQSDRENLKIAIPDRVQTDHPDGHRLGAKAIQKQCDMTKEEAKEIYKALTDYTLLGYAKIRHAQRGEIDDVEYKRKADVLEKFIERSPQWRGGELYRGVKTEAAEYENLRPGVKINMKGISSWSSSKEIADDFATRGDNQYKVMFHVDNPGKATSISHLSQVLNEYEVLVSNSNQYRITKTENENGIKHVWIEWDSFRIEKVDPEEKSHGKIRIGKNPDTQNYGIIGSHKSFLDALNIVKGETIRDVITGTERGIDLSKEEQKTIEKTEDSREFSVMKTDEDKHLVFGWASIATTVDGEPLEDLQRDIIEPEDLEEAVYQYVLNFRDGGEEHNPTMRKKASLIESVVFTKEKMTAMGIPEGILPEGWWIGFYVKDEDAWQKIKDGTYKMFSIEGKAVREDVEKEDPVIRPVAKSFNQVIGVEKFNPYHDR